MLNFDERTGPNYGEATPLYPEPGVPRWWVDAKLGFFVHLGIFSVPAWAVTGDAATPVEEEYKYHRYAEWYGNTVRIEGSPTRKWHQKRYGVGTSYEDLVEHWDADKFNASALVGQLIDAGAQYVVPTTKHHDGFCLWNTETTSFNSFVRGPKRDFIQEIHDATRLAGARFGAYFSGALDWHVSDFPPIQSDRELFLFRRNDETFARYVTAQLEELIERFDPDILWNDIEWPDSGKANDDFGLAAVFTRYLQRVPEGAINDRWGIPYHGFSTREYRRIETLLDYHWEATRGLGRSFGYNQNETDEDSMSGDDLVRLLVDVVAKNGNLLINVGPRSDGSIPDLQAQAMLDMGDWLRTNGEAIYGTRPWKQGVFGEQRIVQKGHDVYVHVLSADRLDLPTDLQERPIEWLGAGEVDEDVPEELRDAPVAVARIRMD